MRLEGTAAARSLQIYNKQGRTFTNLRRTTASSRVIVAMSSKRWIFG